MNVPIPRAEATCARWADQHLDNHAAMHLVGTANARNIGAAGRADPKLEHGRARRRVVRRRLAISPLAIGAVAGGGDAAPPCEVDAEREVAHSASWSGRPARRARSDTALAGDERAHAGAVARRQRDAANVRRGNGAEAYESSSGAAMQRRTATQTGSRRRGQSRPRR